MDFLRGSRGCSFGFPEWYQPSLGYTHIQSLFLIPHPFRPSFDQDHSWVSTPLSFQLTIQLSLTAPSFNTQIVRYKNHSTKLNQIMVQSIFQLQLPEFGAILVASCQVLKIFWNCSKASFNWLQSVERSCALHTLVATFITFNWVFVSSKTVRNWERYNQIHFCATCTRMTWILTHSNFHHFASFNFWIL